MSGKSEKGDARVAAVEACILAENAYRVAFAISLAADNNYERVSIEYRAERADLDAIFCAFKLHATANLARKAASEALSAAFTAEQKILNEDY